MLGNIEPVYIIFAIGAAYSLGYQVLMSKLVDRKKVKAIQAESKRLQKAMSDATKAKDEKKLDEISKEYEKFMPKMLEMSFMQLKPLIFVIPALALLTPFLHETYPASAFQITLPFPLPVIYDGFSKLFSLDISGFLAGFPYWRTLFGSKGWFWISVIAVSLSVSLIRALYNKIIPKKPSGAGEGEEKQGHNPAAKKQEGSREEISPPHLNTGLAGKKEEDKKEN